LIGEEILIKIPVKEIVRTIIGDSDSSTDFTKLINLYSNTHLSNTKYPVTIGSKCKKCEFRVKNNSLKSGYNECWKTIYTNFDDSKPHIFDIWNNRKTKSMIKKDIIYMEDVINNENIFKSLNERQQLQIEKTINNDKTESIDSQLFDIIESWNFPLNFIDFETSMMAIPYNKGKKLYEQIAFQFSCHTIYKDGTISHQEWLSSEPGFNPNFEFVKQIK